MNIVKAGHNVLEDELAPNLKELLEDAFGTSADATPNPPTIPKPIFRLLVLDEQQEVIGHLAVHEHHIGIGNENLLIGMIGEIVIVNHYRRRCYCKKLIKAAHDHFQERSIYYSILFACNPEIYRSSEYHSMKNEMYFLDDDGVWKTFVFRGSMYSELGDRASPNRKIDLRGPVV